MRILFVSAEAAPFAKVGGLADVAGALPKALRQLGHDARLVMPLYRMVEDNPRWNLLTTLDGLDVRMNPAWTKRTVFKETDHEGLPVGFIGTDEWFTEAHNSETLYVPGGTQHLFFARAVMRAMEELDWIPDVIHVNDWHTGFLPVLMRESSSPAWKSVASVFTIHNLAYQGEFGLEALDTLDLPHSLYHPDRVEAWGRVNFLKAGAAFADRVSTVSPTYANEIQNPDFGHRLDGLMRHLSGNGRLTGILNGIDFDVWNPALDRDLPVPFSAEDPSGKAHCRTALLAELGLEPIEGSILLGVVSRMSTQKGIDLILDAAEAMFELPVQLVVQGLGDPAICEPLKALEKRFPRHVRFANRFEPALAQRIYGGADAFLMPSKFEPCGLSQMISMRYGTVPIVRRTGGLADTVVDGVNGFSFERAEPMAFLAAVERAVESYRSVEDWHRIRSAGMRADFSWTNSAKAYADLYADAICDRRRALLAA